MVHLSDKCDGVGLFEVASGEYVVVDVPVEENQSHRVAESVLNLVRSFRHTASWETFLSFQNQGDTDERFQVKVIRI